MMKKQKYRILFVGDTSWPMYASAFYNASQNIDSIEPFLFDFGLLNAVNIGQRIDKRLENKFLIGPNIREINKRLLSAIIEHDIQYVFLYSARIISWRTVKKIKGLGCRVIVYCNDNPFSTYYPKYFWKNIRKSSQFSDICYSYRQSDIPLYYECKASRVELLRSYYIPERNYVIPKSKINREFLAMIPKVIFMGHWESDNRAEYLDALLEAGIEIGLQNSEMWRRFANGKNGVVLIDNYIEQYNEIINSAEIAVVFLSKLNKDTYTRRCFEIPATGTFMIAEYTDDLASLFKENEEVVFFRSKQEFVAKIQYYLQHQSERTMIAENGLKRVIADGHDNIGRIKQVINDISLFYDEKRTIEIDSAK